MKPPASLPATEDPAWKARFQHISGGQGMTLLQFTFILLN